MQRGIDTIFAFELTELVTLGIDVGAIKAGLKGESDVLLIGRENTCLLFVGIM